MLYMPIAYFIPEYRELNILLLFWLIGAIASLAIFVLIAKNWPWRPLLKSSSMIPWIITEFKDSKILYINSLTDTAGTYLNHLLITILLSLELTGVYVFFSQAIGAMSNLVSTGVVSLYKPKLVHSYKKDKSKYANLCIKSIIHSSFTALIMAIVAAPCMYILVHYLIVKPLAFMWLPIFWIMLFTRIFHCMAASAMYE